MHKLIATLATALLFASADATAQIRTVAFYTFDDTFASSDSDSTSVASSVSASGNTMFYDDNLCLTGNWNNEDLTWSINPANTQPLVYTRVEFMVATISQSNPNVTSVRLYVEGQSQGTRQISSTPAGDTFAWNLSPSASFQNGTGTTDFRLLFFNSGNGTRAFEIERLKVKARRSPVLDQNIAPIGDCGSNCFDVTGNRLNEVDEWQIDGVAVGNAGWTVQINNSHSATVCPPAPLVAGNYTLGAVILSEPVSTTTLTIDDDAPVISVVVNPSLPFVTDQCFLIDGCGFLGVTSVDFGSLTITSQNPADFGIGYFRIVSDTRLEFCPPLCQPVGHYNLSLGSTLGQSNSTNVQFTMPSGPTLACSPTHPILTPQCIYISSGGLPGPNNIFLALSSDPSPSVLPGLLNLGIGAQFTSILTANAPPGECTSVCIPFIGPKYLGLTLYFQACMWNFSNPTFPLPVTNICATTYY